MDKANKSQAGGKWPLERALFLMAGTVSLISVALVALVSPWFLILTAFVGVNQLAYVALGKCGASLILTRGFGFCSVVYPDAQKGDQVHVTGREQVAR